MRISVDSVSTRIAQPRTKTFLLQVLSPEPSVPVKARQFGKGVIDLAMSSGSDGSNGVELHREAARVTPGVGATAFASHSGEPDHQRDCRTRLEHSSLGVAADIVGHLESAESAAALGVRLNCAICSIR